MKTFIVSSKDLTDPKKNPNLSLSVSDILKNKKIKKLQPETQKALRTIESFNPKRREK